MKYYRFLYRYYAIDKTGHTLIINRVTRLIEEFETPPDKGKLVPISKKEFISTLDRIHQSHLHYI